MVKIKEAIVVEGRYDKNTLSQIVDAPILETGGFGIFKDKKQMALLDILERIGTCTPFVLLEFPVGAKKRSIIGQCRSLMVGGYCPILAHAERCIAIRREPDVLKRLVEMGVYIQMNAGSITGEEGLSQKWFCKRAMRRNLLHFIGSDAHDPKKYRPNLEKCARYLERTMGAAYRDQIMTGNPREILEGSM